LGGVLVGGDEDFCKISPGSSALYISFLRGFAAAIRREVVGLSDGIAGDGREGGGISLEAVSFVGFTSSAFLLAVWTDAFGMGRVVRGFGAGKGGLEAVGGPGLGGCMRFDTSFDLSLTPVTGSSIVVLLWGGGGWLSINISGAEGLGNSVRLGLWGCGGS
jgi:hypothetical protein